MNLLFVQGKGGVGKSTLAFVAIALDIECGFPLEDTGHKWNRVFRYAPYIAIFGENAPDTSDGTR